MSDSWFVPAGFGQAEITEKKSRFIGRVWRVESADEAAARLREVRRAYPDATHHCSAYIIRENNITRCSDDGEPGGTAGMPILTVLTGSGAVDVLCVVTRYFGGTLLGSGGLVRAYSKTAKMALTAAGLEKIERMSELVISCGYSFYERARLLLEEAGAAVLNADFGESVTITARLRAADAEGLAARVIEASAGKADIR
ncbi:MAG: YigZ family protein [Oscillospiraceae bacterium]|nr:YigZ family protein [Oscillospiraceae bacterium]